MSVRRCFSRGDPHRRWSTSPYLFRAARSGPRCQAVTAAGIRPGQWADGPVTADELQGLLNVDEPFCGPDEDDPPDGWAGSGRPHHLYLRYEARAATIRQFEPQLVPELLRTDGYGGALPPEVLEDRPRRRRIAGHGAALMSFVLDEAVIRRTVGGDAVMQEQLQRLHQLAHGAGVSIRVVPFTSGAYHRMRDPFTLLGFADPGVPDLLYSRGIEGDFLTTDTRLVASYSRSFDLLEEIAPPLHSRSESCSHES